MSDFDAELADRLTGILRQVCAAVQAGEPRAEITCAIRPGIATCATGWRRT